MCVCMYVCTYRRSYTSTSIYRDIEMVTHGTIYLSIYLSTHACICMYICIFRQHFFVNANFIKHNRHFMPTYFLLDPFEFPYYFYRIGGN